MMNKFYTEVTANEAFRSSKESKKPLFVDFWTTGCKGCEKMEKTTYQDPIATDLLNGFVILKYNARNVQKNFKELFPMITMEWTPAFFIISSDGKILRNIMGYLPTGQLVLELQLGLGQNLLRHAKYRRALEIFVSMYHAANQLHYKQEGLYYAGVAAYYTDNGKLDKLASYWNELLAKYPESIWSQRANVL